jgi:hypothetical protein
MLLTLGCFGGIGYMDVGYIMSGLDYGKLFVVFVKDW